VARNERRKAYDRIVARLCAGPASGIREGLLFVCTEQDGRRHRTRRRRGEKKRREGQLQETKRGEREKERTIVEVDTVGGEGIDEGDDGDDDGQQEDLE
jgi:hypothetical protein